MAHFAEIDETNTVVRVLVVGDDEEHRGQEFLADDLGLGGTWIQTSYNTHGGVHYGTNGEPDGGSPRAFNYAGIGHSWDGTGFAGPQPYGSWSLNENYVWEAPVPYPVENPGPDDPVYRWDEATTSWVEVE